MNDDIFAPTSDGLAPKFVKATEQAIWFLNSRNQITVAPWKSILNITIIGTDVRLAWNTGVGPTTISDVGDDTERLIRNYLEAVS